MEDELRAFRLEAVPSIIEIPAERWIVLGTQEGAPRRGKLETGPVFGSKRAADLFIKLDHLTPEPLTDEVIALIERYCIHGSIEPFEEWLRK